MSGGHWNYQDRELELEGTIDFRKIPKILEAVGKVLHKIDYDICGDSIRKDSEPKIYEIMEQLGEDLYG